MYYMLKSLNKSYKNHETDILETKLEGKIELSDEVDNFILY